MKNRFLWVAAIAAILAFAPIVGAADSWVQGFLRDSAGNLDVNVNGPNYPKLYACGAQPCASPSPIATATTVPIIAAVPNQRIFLFEAAFYTTGTNSAAFGQFALTGCASAGVILGANQAFTNFPSGPNGVSVFYGGDTSASTQISPAAVPWALPSGCGLNFVSGGTTIAGFPLVLYAQQ